MRKNEISCIVSNIILKQKGEFLLKDIIEELRKQNKEIEENYIISKLNLMCDYGLIGCTDVYYFSI